MSSCKQSFSWWCCANRGLEPEELLQTAAKIGYGGVELIDESLWPLAVKHGLKIVTAMGHQSISEGLNRRENSRRIEGELRVNIIKAEQWKIPVLICFSGNRDGQNDLDGLEQSAETLARLAPVASAAGVTLAVELLNSKVDHPDYQCDRTAWGVDLCKKINSPAVKLLYDIYHMQIMEGDVIRTIQNNHSYFVHYHTAGNPGRGQPDESQELNYSAIYRAIDATGYTGFIGHEFLPKDDVPKALAQAFQDRLKTSNH